jgi:hypothetical protein
MSMLPLVDREEVKRLLHQRLENLREAAEQVRGQEVDPGHVPPHVVVMVDYWTAWQPSSATG